MVALRRGAVALLLAVACSPGYSRSSMPAEFYTVAGARIVAFDAANGAVRRVLTDPGAHHLDQTPVVGGGYVWFVRAPRVAPCGARVLRVPVGGGPAEPLLPGLPPTDIVRVAVDRAGTMLAYAYVSCGDPRPVVRVVSLATGATVLTARSRFEGNGPLSVNTLTLSGDRLLVGLGAHQDAWFVALDLRPGPEVDLDSAPRVPPESCGSGAPLPAGNAWIAPEVCFADPLDQHLVTYSGDLRTRTITPPLDFSLTGADGAGNLVGVREDLVVELIGGVERTVRACAGPEACAVEPVW